MRKSIRLGLLVLVAIGIGVGVARAGSDVWFSATGTDPGNYNCTEMGATQIHFTYGDDNIRMNTGADKIWMAADNDEINMGPGNDTITFWGESGSTETLAFNDAGTTRIRYTQSNDTIQIKANSGDVVILLGN